MGTQTLLPDLLVAENSTGFRSLGGGAVTVLGALNDGSDTTYVQQAGGAVGNMWTATLRMANFSPALPAGAVVQNVKVQIRYSNANYLNDYEMIQPESILVGRLQGSAHRFFTFTQGEHPTLWAEGATVNAWTGPARVQGFDGDYLGKLLAEESGARLYVNLNTVRNTAHGLARIHAVTVIVTYNEIPVVTVQNPTGSVTVSRPPVTWTHIDPEGDGQKVAQVKFFTAAQYGIGGFDPTTSPYTDFYNEWRTVPNLTPTRPITPNGTWRAYVRTAQVGVSGKEMWSAWAFSQFTLAVTGPAAPSRAAVYDPTVNAIHVTATGAGTFAHANFTIALQRSFDAGVTWEDVPAELTTVNPTAQTLEYWDYAIDGGTTMTYRVQARSYNGSSDPVSSSWSSAVSALLPVFDDWWLRDLTDPIGLSMRLRVLPGFGESWDNPQTVGYGLSDTAATISSDGAKNGPLSGEVDLLDKASYDSFKAMIKGGNTLLLQGVLPDQLWYVRPGESTKVEMHLAVKQPSETTPVRHAHRATVEFIQVEPPSG